MNFLDISYLHKGSNIQKKVYDVLTDLNLFENLKSYSPVLAGTIPINIDIENSDLDIICYCNDFEQFINEIIYYYEKMKDFDVQEKTIRNRLTVISRFTYQDFFIEIFGQNRPVEEQEAYRHMLIEYKILEEKGESFRQEIIALKNQGYKTEPAFAKLLGLDGDPYRELLKY